MPDIEAGAGLMRTPLEAEHRAAGAKMGAFAGWLMPIEYTGTLAEHAAVRQRAGMFDVSHLGKIRVEGQGAFDTLQGTLTNDLGELAPGGAAYGMVLNDDGGIVDDLITYMLEEDRYLVVPNAANRDVVVEAIRTRAKQNARVAIVQDLGLLAVQGPAAMELVGEIFPLAPSLDYMRDVELPYRGRTMIVSRTGYTGERGFELFVPGEMAAAMWAEVIDRGRRHGLLPCGLAARDTLRLEMGYPLHGNDIGPDTTPRQAGLMWAVDLDKGDFPGRAALVRQTDAPSRLWGLRMTGKLIPRPHYPVFAEGERVGETTSGTFSPTLRVGIALAYLGPRERFSSGDSVEVEVRGRRGQALVTKPPFVDRSPR